MPFFISYPAYLLAIANSVKSKEQTPLFFIVVVLITLPFAFVLAYMGELSLQPESLSENLTCNVEVPEFPVPSYIYNLTLSISLALRLLYVSLLSRPGNRIISLPAPYVLS